jgi:hypothetical protein
MSQNASQNGCQGTFSHPFQHLIRFPRFEGIPRLLSKDPFFPAPQKSKRKKILNVRIYFFRFRDMVRGYSIGQDHWGNHDIYPSACCTITDLL